MWRKFPDVTASKTAYNFWCTGCRVVRRDCRVICHMSNSTKVPAPKIAQNQLATLVDIYRELLRSDERRLHEAMLEYERSCWTSSCRRSA